MRKSVLLPAAVMLFLSLAFGCRKVESPPDAPPGDPHACFTPSSVLVDSGEVISFSNCSENGQSWLWDMGKGKLYDKNITYSYDTLGTYPVKLTAYGSSQSVSDDTVQNIVVGHRSLIGFSINKLNLPSHTDGSGANLSIVFGPTSSPSLYSSRAVNNVRTLPVNLALEHNIILNRTNNSDWSFKVIDDYNGVKDTLFSTNGIYPSRGHSPVIVSATASSNIGLEYEIIK
jgi:PKD repeat protein